MDDRQEPTLDGEASELAEARATIRRLNRRCQSAERGLAEKLEDAKRSGGSLGRGLANSAAVLYRARLDDAERERAAIARELGVEPTFDLATHLRGVLATRDAWVDQSAELLALQEESDEDVSHRAWVESLELRNAELSEELDSLRSESEAVKAERATAIEAMLKTLHESSSDYEAALESARSESEAQLDDWRNREAACCPEDVGFEEYIGTLKRQLAASQAESEALRRDKERLDWLETMAVNVRKPARYGSFDAFWASPESEDGFDPTPSDLRAKVDAAVKIEKAQP